MDLKKLSVSVKTPSVNNGGAEQCQEDPVERWRDGEEREREGELFNGGSTAAETAPHQPGAVESHTFNNLTFQRKTQQKVVTDYATISKSSSLAVRPRAALKQVLFNQGAPEKSSPAEERGQLDVLKQVLEAFPVPACLRWSWGEGGQGSALENSWSDIVRAHTTMSKTQRHQQEALWEFVHTELTYINKLTIVTDLVVAALTNLHQHGFLQEVTSELLFSNLPSILAAHRKFWQEVMYPMLQEVRRTGKSFDPLRLESGCLQFHERFSSYLQYCWEEESTLDFTRRELDNNPHFNIYLMWVETHPQCERMRLGDMQAKPHQRITKYPLLLKAIIKATQDPLLQHRLRAMLSGVNRFLDSINDYMKLKDEELALSISAQRLEGYEVLEGTNDEIDKHVREFCQFDLTTPIRGVGPGVIRKLLLEETLKIRGRKDSKVVVVALLFSDVLLVTKAEKKAERLKVVRPPLPLDRARCAALKDGCSFVLVEVSDLGCAVNVYAFSASSLDSCSKWVSSIQQAQETLKNLRLAEMNRILQAQLKPQQLKLSSPADAHLSNGGTVELAHDQSEPAPLEVKPAVEPPVIPSEKETLSSAYQLQTPQLNTNSDRQVGGLLGRERLLSDTHSKSVRGDFAGWTEKIKQGDKQKDKRPCSEPGVRENRSSDQLEDKGDSVFQGITERRVTWNHHKPVMTPDLSDPSISRHDPGRTVDAKSNRRQFLFPGEYPDVDYPLTRPRACAFSYSYAENTLEIARAQFKSRMSQGDENRSRETSRVSESSDNGPRRESWCSQSEEETMIEHKRFSRKLKSPRLRRRRHINSQQNIPPQSPRRGSVPALWPVSQNYSSSNSDSEVKNPIADRRGSSAPDSTDSRLVLKLGALRLNREEFWHIPVEKVPPDPQTITDPELPKKKPATKSYKKNNLKAQRSVSNPDLVLPDEYPRPGHLSRLHIPHSPPGYLDLPPQPSPVECLLERAKGRNRDPDRGQRNTSMSCVSTLYFSPSFSGSTSPFTSEGDREVELEEVELVRHRAPTVSQGWREAAVDGDQEDSKPVDEDQEDSKPVDEDQEDSKPVDEDQEDSKPVDEDQEDNKSFPVFLEGTSVDWPGWSFDDSEVMDYLSPARENNEESLLQTITDTLNLQHSQRRSERRKGEVSQV